MRPKNYWSTPRAGLVFFHLTLGWPKDNIQTIDWWYYSGLIVTVIVRQRWDDHWKILKDFSTLETQNPILAFAPLIPYITKKKVHKIAISWGCNGNEVWEKALMTSIWQVKSWQSWGCFEFLRDRMDICSGAKELRRGPLNANYVFFFCVAPLKDRGSSCIWHSHDE